MRIPFFHYTNIENLQSILVNKRIISRDGLKKTGTGFNDVSIDPTQPVRKDKNLWGYIPLFPGFYTYNRSNQFGYYLKQEYDKPIVQNKSFYGTLHKTLRTKMGNNYENIIIFLVKDALIYQFADKGKVRFFKDIAVKPNVPELPVKNRQDLTKCLKQNISEPNISGEVDLQDDSVVSIGCTSDIEAIIVDNQNIFSKVSNIINKFNTCETKPAYFISPLPRN
jgi:hypothetical protein